MIVHVGVFQQLKRNMWQIIERDLLFHCFVEHGAIVGHVKPSSGDNSDNGGGRDKDKEVCPRYSSRF